MPPLEKASAHGDEPAPGSKSDLMTADFRGDVGTSDEVPTREMIAKAADIPIVDTDGKEMPFKNLYLPSQDDGDGEGRRTLIIFIRHFFCGSCQDYIRFLASSLPPQSLPPSTNIVVIGCGSHSLIQMYADETSCPYPIYANPSRSLYDIFGMIRTMSLGAQPEYIKGSLASYVVKGIMQAAKRIGAGDMLKGGDSKQVGGEFLFTAKTAGVDDKRSHENTDVKVSWCHRMRNTRNHSSTSDLREVLGMGAESKGEEDNASS